MKHLILLSSLIIVLASCGSLRHSNFSKQKFTSLKKIKVNNLKNEVSNETYLAPVIASEDTLSGDCDTLYFKSGKTITCTILKETDDVITFDNCPPTGSFFRVQKEKLIGYDEELVEEEVIIEEEEIELEEEVFVLDTLNQTDTTKKTVSYEEYKEKTENNQTKIESYNLLFGIGLALFLVGIFTLFMIPAIGAIALLFSWVMALIMMVLGKRNKEMLSKNVNSFKFKNTLAWLWGMGVIVASILPIVILIAILAMF